MAEKKVQPHSPKTGVQEPAGISFDFENMIATAVAAVALKKPRERRIITGRRDPYHSEFPPNIASVQDEQIKEQHEK